MDEKFVTQKEKQQEQRGDKFDYQLRCSSFKFFNASMTNFEILLCNICDNYNGINALIKYALAVHDG